MTWRRTLFLGLMFGVAGLAYAAWRGKRERDNERRRRLIRPCRKYRGTAAVPECVCVYEADVARIERCHRDVEES